MIRRSLSLIVAALVLSSLRGGCAEEAKPLEKLAISCFVPWHTLNHTAGMAQRYYDMPLRRAPGGVIENLRTEILEMASYGFDAIATDMAPNAEGTTWVFRENFARMLEAAEGTPVKIILMMDRLPETPIAEEQLVRMVRDWGHKSSWLKVDGRPVVCTFWGGRFPPELFQKIQARLAQDGVSFYWMGDPACHFATPMTMPELRRYTGLFDVLYTFCEYGRNGKQTPREVYQTLAEAAPEVARAQAWCAGIVPGYVGGWIPGRNEYYNPFRNIDHFVDLWRAALDNRPSWVYVTTWNDRDETPIQPTLYQWETLSEITAFYIHLWKTGSFPEQERRFYASYPREQLLGSVQRMEVLSLPGRDRGEATVWGELRTEAGAKLADLPRRTLAGGEVARADWAVETIPLAGSPVVYPVLFVEQGGAVEEHRLPAFVLRSGWIENQTVVKFPLRRGGRDEAGLTVRYEDNGLVHAEVTYAGTEKIKSAELYRNDRRIADLDPRLAGQPRGQFLVSSRGPEEDIVIEVVGGKVLRALRSDASTEELLHTSDHEIRVHTGLGLWTAFEVAMTPGTQFVVRRSSGEKSTLAAETVVAAEDQIKFPGTPLTLQLAKFDSLVDVTPTTGADAAEGWRADVYLGAPRWRDSFHARLETESGEIIETPWQYPGLKDVQLVKTQVIRTPLSLDIPRVSDYIAPPEDVTPAVRTVEAHPAIFQAATWKFDDAANPAIDSVGRNSLSLGRGDSYLAPDAKRMPQWLAGQGVKGGGCLSFDGVNDRAQLPVQQEPKGPFRVAFDLYLDGEPKGVQTILAGVPPEDLTTPGIAIRRQADGRLIGGRNGAGLVTSSKPLPIKQWVHVQVLFDGVKTRLLFDDEVVGEGTNTPDFKRFGNSRVYLGGPAQPFRGRIDNLVIEGFSL